MHHPSSSYRDGYAFECPGFCGRLLPGTNITWNGKPSTSNEFDGGWQKNSGGASSAIELIFEHCKPCPWGMRTSHRSLCQPCDVPLHSYDYLFLVFHAIAPFFVNSTAIVYYTGSRLKSNQRRLFWLFLQTFCALFESSLAFFCALLFFTPLWNLQIVGCQKEGTLREWYSMWHNPVLEYSRVLQCSYELVYPLFSLPFVLYAFNLVNLLIFRTLLYTLAALSYGRRNLLPTGPFYIALWTLPLLALGHAIMSGLFYALFPYLALFASLILLVVHLSAQSSPQQQPSGRSGPSVCGMFRRVFCFHRGHGRFSSGTMSSSTYGGPLLLILLIHLAIFAFSLLSMAVAGTPNGQFNELTRSTRLTLLLAMPPLLSVPLLFFILTVRLTAPNATSGRTQR